MFLQLLSGVQYIHANGIVHRWVACCVLRVLLIDHSDLKPENVVVSADGIAKICDFGMAERHGGVVKHGSGTGPYMAPVWWRASR